MSILTPSFMRILIDGYQKEQNMSLPPISPADWAYFSEQCRRIMRIIEVPFPDIGIPISPDDPKNALPNLENDDEKE